MRTSRTPHSTACWSCRRTSSATTSPIAGLQTLDEFFRLFAVHTVREGADIVGLEFEDRYLLELDDVFRALGPYVEPGSWVLFHSGTTDRWRYVFDGGVDRRTEPPRPWYGR